MPSIMGSTYASAGRLPRIGSMRGSLFGSTSTAGILLGAETSGLAIDFTAPSNRLLIRSADNRANYLGNAFVNDGGPVSFSRASLGTVVDSDGKIKWAPHNLLLASEQFDAASWVKTTTTVAANSVAAPNSTTTAETLTAGGANSTALQSYSASAVAYTFGVWLRRKTGTGTIQIAADSGTWNTVTITADWALYTITQTPAAGTISAGIRIVTSGDEVYAWGAHLYRSDLGGMQANMSAYPMYNPTTAKNLLGYTEAFDNAAWGLNATAITRTANATSAPNGLQTGNSITGDGSSAIHYFGNNITLSSSTTYTLSFYAKANGVNFVQAFIGGGTGYANFDLVNGIAGTNASPFGVPSMVAAGNGWFRCSVPIVAPSFSQVYFCLSNSASATRAPSFATSNGIYLWGAQLSDSASLDPYVANHFAAPSAAAYHGPRFDYDPATLAPRGLLVEEQRANLALWSNDLTNAAWTASNVTTAKTATGPDGTANSATTLTASATDGTVLQAITSASAARITSMYVKRRTGSGTIDMTQDNGSTWTAVTVTSSWTRVNIASATAANPTVGIRIQTNGDAIDVFGFQHELGAFITSLIPSTSATVTRSADVASVSTGEFPYSSSASTLVLAATVFGPGAGNKLLELSASASANGLAIYQSASLLRLNAFVDASSVIIGNATVGAVQKVGIAYNGSSNGAVINGGTVNSVGTTVSAAATKLSIGTAFNNGSVMNGHICQITYIPRRLTNAELQAKTA